MKIYTDQRLGNDILLMIKQKASVVEIAKWAYHIYQSYDDKFTSTGNDALNSLMMMEQGEEFAMNEKELKNLAKSLLPSDKESQ